MCVVNAVLEGGLAGSYDNSIAIMCCVGWRAQEIPTVPSPGGPGPGAVCESVGIKLGTIVSS